MDRQTLQELRLVVEPFVKERGYELVDMYFRFESGRMILGMLVDKPEGGITIDECTFLNREICVMMDEKDAINEPYFLEVSSPGIDRPLTSKEDFRRCKNRTVTAYLRQPVLGKLELTGEVKDVDDSILSLACDGQDVQVPLENISKAKQTIR
ncbi:MAG: ribosome maturation factor RimP [Candidatus Omnitrophota bacterium]